MKRIGLALLIAVMVFHHSYAMDSKQQLLLGTAIGASVVASVWSLHRTQQMSNEVTQLRQSLSQQLEQQERFKNKVNFIEDQVVGMFKRLDAIEQGQGEYAKKSVANLLKHTASKSDLADLRKESYQEFVRKEDVHQDDVAGQSEA